MPTAAAFTVTEHALTGKSATKACEDGLVVTEHFAAVIDGATTPRWTGTDGRTSGTVAKDALVRLLHDLPATATLTEFLTAATAAIADEARASGMDPHYPTAVTAIYSAHHRQLWSVGDARWSVTGHAASAERRDVDQVAAAARAAILHAELLSGATVEDLRTNDVGRERTAALRAAKVTFRNNLAAGPYAFAALNGATDVPLELTETIDVSAGATVVLTTDGYLSPAPTLVAAETQLWDTLAADPLCIDLIKATKCPARAGETFDDRTYLRLTTA